MGLLGYRCAFVENYCEVHNTVLSDRFTTTSNAPSTPLGAYKTRDVYL